MQTAILESKHTEAVRQLEEVTRKFEETNCLNSCMPTLYSTAVVRLHCYSLMSVK